MPRSPTQITSPPTNTVSHCVDVRRHRCGGLRMAATKFDRQRCPRLMTEQPDHDLPFPPLPIAMVPKSRQCVLVPFYRATRHIIEKEARVWGARVLPGEAILTRRLVLLQPIEVGIPVVLRQRRQAEHLADGMRPGSAHGGESSAWVNDPCDDVP